MIKGAPKAAGKAPMKNWIFCSNEFTPEQALDAAHEHCRTMSGARDGVVIKRSRKTNVTMFDGRGRASSRLCVKQFVRPGLSRLLPRFWRHRPALRSWQAAQRLERKGIGAPQTFAVIAEDRKSSYVIMAEMEGYAHLRDYARSEFARDAGWERRGRFVRAAADFLIRCYDMNVFHEDLKATNFFIREDGDGWTFALLDLAAVAFPRRIRLDNMLLNLAQLNASVPAVITRTDRLRFLRRLAVRWPMLISHDALAEIARMTRMRGGS